MGGMKRILAINGSPRGRASNTQRLVNAFFEGAAQAGAACETLFATELNEDVERGVRLLAWAFAALLTGILGAHTPPVGAKGHGRAAALPGDIIDG